MQDKVSCKSLVFKMEPFLSYIAEAMGRDKTDKIGNQWLANELL